MSIKHQPCLVMKFDNMSAGVMLQEIVGWGADRRAADRLAWVRLSVSLSRSLTLSAITRDPTCALLSATPYLPSLSRPLSPPLSLSLPLGRTAAPQTALRGCDSPTSFLFIALDAGPRRPVSLDHQPPPTSRCPRRRPPRVCATPQPLSSLLLSMQVLEGP